MPTTLPLWSAVVLVFAGIGFYEAALFAGFARLRPADPRLRSTAILALTMGGYAFVMAMLYTQISVPGALAWTRARVAVVAFMPAVLVSLAEDLLFQPPSRVRRLAWPLGAALALAALLQPELVLQTPPRVRELVRLRQTVFDFPPGPATAVFFVICGLIAIYLVWLTIRRLPRNEMARAPVIGFGLFFLFGLLDALTVMGVTDLPFLLEFGCVVIVVATNRSLLEEHFDLLNEKEKLVAMRSRLLTNVSHELRTPLGAAMGYLQILKRSRNLNDNQREAVARAYSSLQDEAELITQLIDISRFAVERPAPERKPLLMGEMVTQICDRLRLPAERKDVRLVVEGDLDVVACVDPKWFPLAVKNLVHNAIKFSPQGADVRIQLHEFGDELVVRVRDRGRGIPLREQRLIFERFAQGGNQKDNDLEAGLGIGLALVRDVAEAHGGGVTLASRVWKGSVFEIRIPLVRPEDAGDAAPPIGGGSITGL